jgi:predicted secreted hydrolase
MSEDSTENIYTSSKKSPFTFHPKDISLKDDAFHGSKASRFTEWWYFDTVFDNGYSTQMSVRVLSIIKNRLVLVPQRLDIYKDGWLVKHSIKRCPYKKFEPSTEKPLVKIFGKTVIEGRIDKDTGRWIYDLDFEIGDYGAKLRFEGVTKGWKGQNLGNDWWVVALPGANVKGILKVNNKKIDVKGVGYHDHNWDVRYSASKNHGWFWGKINTESYNITWATIYKTRDLGQPILVINEKNGGYINIKPENIDFLGKDLKLNHKKEIPHYFNLKAKDEKVDLDFNMKVIDVHHSKIMSTMNYWRYHVLCDGYIKVNSKKETIKETYIAELLRFR